MLVNEATGGKISCMYGVAKSQVTQDYAYLVFISYIMDFSIAHFSIIYRLFIYQSLGSMYQANTISIDKVCVALWCHSYQISLDNAIR